MAQIKRFRFSPDNGSSGRTKVTISAESFAGRKESAAANVKVHKVGGGLERYLTVKQAAKEFFKIDSIVKDTLSSGVTNITIQCSGNIALKNIVCGGLEYYGLSLTKVNSVTGGAKPWVVSYKGTSTNIPVQKTNDYGVVLAKVADDLDFIGTDASYTLTAYLTAPKVTSTTVYNLFFGKYSGNLNVSVDSVMASDVLDKADNYGKISITVPERGFVTLSPVRADISNSDTGYTTVYVETGGQSWEIDPATVEDWVSIEYPDVSDAMYGKCFKVAATGPNTVTDKRTCALRVMLVADNSIYDYFDFVQGESASSWLHIFLVSTETVEGDPLTDRIPSEGFVTNLVVYANGPWTMNTADFPNWIHLGTEYEGNGEYDRIYDISFDSIGAEDRSFAIIGTYTNTGETYTRNVRQEVPVPVHVTGVTPGMPVANLIVDHVIDDYGHAVFVLINPDYSATERTLTFDVEATGPWTYSVMSSKYAEVLEKTDSSITIKFKRSDTSSMWRGSVNLYSNGIVRSVISAKPYSI